MRRETRTEAGRRPTRERFTVVDARGGVSLWSVLTGVVVAFGAMLILSAIIGGILAETGVDANDVAQEGPTDAGLGLGIGMIASMFLAYLWGGYTAGRMARGAGPINGFLVPLLAIIIGVIVAAILNATNADANLNLPFTENTLTVEDTSVLYDWAGTIGIGMLIAMFVGGILGGLAGHGWHRKLERRELHKREAEQDAAVAQREAEAARERERAREHEDTRAREVAAAGRERQAANEREVAREREDHITERGGAAAERTPATDQPRSVRIPNEDRTRR
jgi:signal transduction histidine kinase